MARFMPSEPGEFPRVKEPVEKVAARSIGDPKPGSKRLKTGLSVPEQGSEKDMEEFFNRLGKSRQASNESSTY